MHPSTSVIFFTTAAGIGYGLLFLLGLFAPAGLTPDGRGFGFVALALALGLVTAGLIASTFHLGHPERAWRAFSQWRSSWLSREGVAAVATYVPAGLFALGWVFLERTVGFWGLMGALAALGAVATLVCTGQIYASLPTIRQWHHPLVTPLYLALALATGAVWLNALLALWNFRSAPALALAVAATLLAWALKLAYWRAIDRDRSPSTPETATGLGALGEVRQLDPPHAEPNYVMKEMGYTVARRHAAKLRRIALAAGLAAPLVLLALQALAGVAGPLAAAPALLAALAGTLGVAVERWLFFAEATHVAMLYYGRRAA